MRVFFSFLLLMWCHRYYTLSLQTGKRPRRVRSQFFIVSWIPQNHKTGNWMKTSSLVIKHQHKTIRGWKHNLILNMLEFGRNWHPFVSHSCQWFPVLSVIFKEKHLELLNNFYFRFIVCLVIFCCWWLLRL